MPPHENYQLLSIMPSVCVQIWHFVSRLSLSLSSVLWCLLYSHHICVCCCGRISPSQCLLYLEAKHYQSVQLAACDSILTDLQLSKQSPLFLSRSFFCLSPPPLPFSLTSLTNLSCLSSLHSFHLFLLSFRLFSPSYFKPISVQSNLSQSLPFLLCLYCFFIHFNRSIFTQFIFFSFLLAFFWVSFPLFFSIFWSALLVFIGVSSWSASLLPSTLAPFQFSPHLFHSQCLSGTLYPTRLRNESFITLSKASLKKHQTMQLLIWEETSNYLLLHPWICVQRQP